MQIGFRHLRDARLSQEVLFRVTLTEEGLLVVTLEPYTGDLKIFVDNGSLHIGSFEISDPEIVDKVRPLIEESLAKCVAEVLGVD